MGGGGGKRIFGEFSKIEQRDDGTIVVSGIASTEDVDKDGEVVKADAMRLAIPGYMKFGAIREMHQPTAAGTALACEVHGDGKTYLEAHIVDPVAVLKVRTGTYKGFSIGGRVPPGGRNVHDAKIIEALVLTEISLVDSPANPAARIQLFKADGLTDDTVSAEVLAEGDVNAPVVKGDAPGHPFRGNQYGDGSSDGPGVESEHHRWSEDEADRETREQVEGGHGTPEEKARIAAEGKEDLKHVQAPPPDAEAIAPKKDETRVTPGKTVGGYHHEGPELAATLAEDPYTAQNVSYGFYGGMRDIERRDPDDPDKAEAEGWEWERSKSADAAYAHAREEVKRVIGGSDEDARDLLDSPFGRHLADSVADGKTPFQALNVKSTRLAGKQALRDIRDQRDTDAKHSASNAEPERSPEEWKQYAEDVGAGGKKSGTKAEARERSALRQMTASQDKATATIRAGAKAYTDRRAASFDSGGGGTEAARASERKSLYETNPMVRAMAHGSSGTAPAGKKAGPSDARRFGESPSAAAARARGPRRPFKADVEIDLTKRLDGFTDEGEPIYTVLKGDVPGHEFRGNQYSHGGGSGAPNRETKGFGKDGQPVVGRQTKAPARKKSVRQPDAAKDAERADSNGAHRAAAEHHKAEATRHRRAGSQAKDAQGAAQHNFAAQQHAIAEQAHRTARDTSLGDAGRDAATRRARDASARAHKETGFTTFSPKADTDIDITKAAPGAPQEEAMADPKAMAQGEAADAAVCDDCGATLVDGACPECAAEGGEAEAGSGSGAGSSGEVAADPSTGTRDDDATDDGTSAEGNRFQARAAKLAKAANVELAALRKERDAEAARARAAEEALADLRAQATTTSTKLAKVASRADEVTGEVTKMRRAHAEVSETLEKVSAERDGMRERLAKVQAERDAVSADALRIRSDNDDAEHAVAKLTGDRDSMSERLAKVQQERDRADEELGKVRAARDFAETSFEKVAAEKAITDSRLSKVSVERDNAVADAAKMRVERDAVEDRFEKAVTERDVLAQRATKAQAELNATGDRLAKVQANAERAEITITKMASEIDAANQRAARLSKAVDAAEALASSTAASLDAERVTLAKVNAETATLRKALDRARVERDDVAKARDEATAENARKLEEISTIKKAADRARVERDEAARARDAALSEAQRKGEEIDGLKKVAERDRLVAKAEATRAREVAAADAQRKAEEIDSIKKALDRERLVAKTEIAKKVKEADDLRKAASVAADAAANARKAKLAAESERDAANSELARRPKGALRAALPVEKGLDTASAQTGEEAAKPEAPASPMDAIRKAHQNPKLLQNVNR
jgi:predicted nuclease with TOPRIM domain